MKNDKRLKLVIIITASLAALVYIQLQLIWCCAFGPLTGLGGLVIVGGVFAILLIALLIELIALLVKQTARKNIDKK
jgi:uncharacterized membrane protein